MSGEEKVTIEVNLANATDIMERLTEVRLTMMEISKNLTKIEKRLERIKGEMG